MSDAFKGTTFEGCTADDGRIETLRERNADLQTKIHMLEHELLVEREATLYLRIELQHANRNLTSVQARCTELREENLKLKCPTQRADQY